MSIYKTVYIFNNEDMNERKVMPAGGHIPNLNTFANRLRAAREYAGLKQTELAELAQISPTTISMAEKGHQTPQRGTVALLALSTGVNFQWLLTGEQQESPSPDGDGLRTLPQLDLNQQPFDYMKAQVRAGRLISFYDYQRRAA